MPINAPATLKELSDYYAKKQPHQVDTLTEETPILARLKFEQASHGLWNTAESVSDVQGAGLVEMNSPLPKVGMATKLEKIDLNIFGGEIEVPEDTAQMYGGKEKYFARKMPTILRESGMGTEKTLYYKNYLGYSLATKDRALNANGTASGAAKTGLYTIIALRQVSGENIGLYSPEGFKQGAMFDTKPINGGNLYKNEKGVLVYGARLKSYLGWQILNPNTVGAIVNINEDNLPTKIQVNRLLANVRATPASTMLFMHPVLRDAMLNVYKDDAMQVTPATKDLNYLITHWNGIEIVSSYNISDGNEKQYTPK